MHFTYKRVSVVDMIIKLCLSANNTSGKNHFHEMNGDVGMAGWK